MKIKRILIILLGAAPFLAQAQWSKLTNTQTFTGMSLSSEQTSTVFMSNSMGQTSTMQYTHNDHAQVKDVFNHDQSYESVHFTNSSSIGADSARYFSGELSQDEQHLGSVFKMDRWLLGFSAGSGENYVKAKQAFTGVNPYFIHGGSATQFRYYGANAGIQLSNKTLFYFGGTTISADALEDRNTYYTGVQTKRLSTTLMNFSRGGQSIGKGINFSTTIAGAQFNYRQISRHSGAHSKTLELNLPLNRIRAGRLGFGIESINNPLYRVQDDTRFMLTFSGEWGKPRSTFNIDEQANDVNKGSSGKKMILIGTGVVAGALIASSGSSSKDDASIITAPGQHEAARVILNEVNPASVRENREYGGLIYRNPDGSYANTTPVAGDNDSVFIPNTAPAGTQLAAVFHTHAAFDPRYDNENFSPTDINSARSNNLDSYLGTPAGAFKFYDVSSGDVSQLGTIEN